MGSWIVSHAFRNLATCCLPPTCLLVLALIRKGERERERRKGGEKKKKKKGLPPQCIISTLQAPTSRTLLVREREDIQPLAVRGRHLCKLMH